jgi:hypothetical protein
MLGTGCSYLVEMSPSKDLSLPFKFKRKQFPMRLSSTMTINKAHGQMLPTIGVYLPNPVFSHGQLYVALSRVYLKAPPGFYVNPARKSIPKAIALGILCILTSLELHAFYIISYMYCLSTVSTFLDLLSCSVSLNFISVLRIL